jgi:hypothetical protein
MLDRIHRPAVAGVAGHALTWGLPRKAAAEGGFVQQWLRHQFAWLLSQNNRLFESDLAVETPNLLTFH